MWKQIKDKHYFLSFIESHVYEIYLTDFISIWNASYTEKEFIAQVKKSNKSLILESDKDYKENVTYLLNNGVDTIKYCSFEENGDDLHLTLRTVIEFPFSFVCTLAKGSKELYFKKVAQPLLETIHDLKSSEHDLIQILAKKDKEIKAYKRELEDKEIIFRHEVTKAFSDGDHKKLYRVYDKVFGSQSIPKDVFRKSIKLPQDLLEQTNVPNIKQEPGSTKQAPTNLIQTGNVKQEQHIEPVNVRQGPSNVMQEPGNVKSEPLDVKEEATIIKQEVCTPVFNESLETQLVTQPLSCNQDIIKPETSQARINNRRKKMKLSY